MAKQVYGYKTKRDFERVDRVVQRVERMESRPKRGKKAPRRGGGGGTSVNTDAAIVRLTASMLGATGSNPRAPRHTEAYEVIRGDATGIIANWSVVPIPNGTYCGLIFVDDEWVIYAAWC